MRFTTLAVTLAMLVLPPAVAIGGPLKTPAPNPSLSVNRPAAGNLARGFGVYDPNGIFGGEGGFGIEHVFMSWRTPDIGWLSKVRTRAESRGRQFMLSVEPFTMAVDWVSGGDHLFSDIQAGRFDSKIDAICGDLAKSKTRPLVRWGHEMEDPTGRYPWARTDAAGYIAAYRHFVERCRATAPKALFVWSPKGESNLARYYPGSAWVDRVGLPVWGLETADKAWYGHARGFVEAASESYARVARFSKPVVFAETGFYGSDAYRQRWQDEMVATLTGGGKFPRLTAIVLFADKEPADWPWGFGKPDWRIGARQIAAATGSVRVASASSASNLNF